MKSQKLAVYSSVRVKRVIDGKASGKSFRVYKATIGTEHEYLEYRGNAKVDHLVLDFEVTESYERIQPPIKRNLREDYKRKSSSCPKKAPSTEVGKINALLRALNKVKKTPEQVKEAHELKKRRRGIKTIPKKSIRKERINELLRYFNDRRKDHSKVMASLVTYKKDTWSKKPKK